MHRSLSLVYGRALPAVTPCIRLSQRPMESNGRQSLAEHPPLPSLKERRPKSNGYTKIVDGLEDVSLIGDSDEYVDEAEAMVHVETHRPIQQDVHTPQANCLLPDLPKRYEPNEKDKLSEQEIEELAAELMKVFDAPEATNDPYMSPMLAPPNMLTGLPPVHLVGAALDPLVDDSVAMAQKLQSVNQPVTLDIISRLPHGFLCMMSLGNNSDLNHAHRLCLTTLKKELYPVPKRVAH